MNPINITINIQTTPDGVTVTQVQQPASLATTQAPGPAELHEPEAAMESTTTAMLAEAPPPLDLEATATLDDTVDVPAPISLEELDDLAKAS